MDSFSSDRVWTEKFSSQIHLLNIMYNISDFLMVPAKNKVYEGAARVYFIYTGTSKKPEMLYITWLNVEVIIHFITVAKRKMYCMGVKSTASGLTCYTKSGTFYSLPIHFNFYYWANLL